MSVSQNRALTWAIPTRETASSRDGAGGRSVSSWMTAAIMSAHSVVTRSTWPPHGGLAGEVGLEDQTEGARVMADVGVEGVDRGGDPLLVVVGRLERLAAVGDDGVARGVEDRQVELELAGEVLVEHRLGDPGALGDVVHRGGVVALRDEHLEGSRQQLRPPLAAGEAYAARPRLVQVELLDHHGPEPTRW